MAEKIRALIRDFGNNLACPSNPQEHQHFIESLKNASGTKPELGVAAYIFAAKIPLTAGDVHAHLDKSFGDTTVEKALEELKRSFALKEKNKGGPLVFD